MMEQNGDMVVQSQRYPFYDVNTLWRKHTLANACDPLLDNLKEKKIYTLAVQQATALNCSLKFNFRIFTVTF